MGRRKGQPKTGGRRKGSGNALPLGAVGAIKALRHRIPEGTPEELAQVADRAFGVMVDVMDGKITRYSGSIERLQAARAVREEIAAPQQLKVQHSLADQHALVAFAAIDPDPRKLEQARQQLGGPQLVVPPEVAQLRPAVAAEVAGIVNAPDRGA